MPNVGRRLADRLLIANGLLRFTMVSFMPRHHEFHHYQVRDWAEQNQTNRNQTTHGYFENRYHRERRNWYQTANNHDEGMLLIHLFFVSS